MDLERTNRVRIYLSGPIFSQAEIEWARHVKGMIEKSFAPGAEVIWENMRALDQCQIVVAILDGPQVDDGTAWEVGYHYARGGKVLGIRTDFRNAGEAPESWANAMIEFSCVCIVNSPDQLLLKLKELLET
jgi:nucleoside 2-deoxyribosyltransferase